MEVKIPELESNEFSVYDGYSIRHIFGKPGHLSNDADRRLLRDFGVGKIRDMHYRAKIEIKLMTDFIMGYSWNHKVPLLQKIKVYMIYYITQRILSFREKRNLITNTV